VIRVTNRARKFNGRTSLVAFFRVGYGTHAPPYEVLRFAPNERRADVLKTSGKVCVA
jgi:hypothetical protein